MIKKNWIFQCFMMVSCLCTMMAKDIEAANQHHDVQESHSSHQCLPPDYTITNCPHLDGVQFPVFVDQMQTLGVVTISNSNLAALQVSVDMSSTTYVINEVHIFAAASESSCDKVPLNKEHNPKIGKFPIESKYYPATSQASFSVAIDQVCDFENIGQCFEDIHMVVALELTDTSRGNHHIGFVQGSSHACWCGRRWGYCLIYRMCLETTGPVFTHQPTSQGVCTGNEAIFLATATDEVSIISYQWQKNSVNLVNGPTGSGSTISGATTNQLIIGTIGPDDAGSYTLVVTDACNNVATSNPAELTVFIDTITEIIVTNGGAGYLSTPTVTITGGGGSGATAIASITGGAVTSITVINGGTGYTSTPSLIISGGGGADATATAIAACSPGHAKQQRSWIKKPLKNGRQGN